MTRPAPSRRQKDVIGHVPKPFLHHRFSLGENNAMKRPCLDCGTPATGSRCPEHTRQAQRQRDIRRGTAHARGYNAEYRHNRRIVLEESNYACRWCGRYANTVDHVIPLSRGGSNDVGNLVASCAYCNSRRGGELNRGDAA